MDITRKANLEAQELTLQYRSRQTALDDEHLIEDKLAQLLTFICELEQTSEGAVEIQRRVKQFGKCKRGKGETSAEFYAKLRHWLDKDLPQAKSPLRRPRQSEEV